MQVTAEMLNVQWNQVVIYPAGHFARQIQVDADLKVPAGWELATALERPRRQAIRPRSKPCIARDAGRFAWFAGHTRRPSSSTPPAARRFASQSSPTGRN